MNNIIFEYITEFVKNLPFPKTEFSFDNCLDSGNTIQEDEDAQVFDKIIAKRLHSPSKKSPVDASEGISLNHERLTNCLDAQQKFVLFVLLTRQYYNPGYNEIYKGFEDCLEAIAHRLEVSKKSYREIIAFYKTNIPFNDKTDSIYFVDKKANQLIRSKGVNVQFNLKMDGEIIYLKHIQKYNVFLSKTFYKHRPANSIIEKTSIKELNIINKANFYLMGIEGFDYKTCLNSISHFTPFNSVTVKETDNTPELILDAELSRISISGHSTPLSPTNYFEPVYDWLNNYVLFGEDHLELHFKLHYYNTYTSKFILKLISLCKKMGNLGKQINVFWYSDPEDDEMLEFGEHLQSVFKQKFNFLSIRGVNAVEV